MTKGARAGRGTSREADGRGAEGPHPAAPLPAGPLPLGPGPEGAWPVVVAGAGAAGLTAAIFAARAGARALALETRPAPGAKIRVSGGGRCNVLPVAAGPDDFRTSGSRAVVRNVLRTWPLADVRAFFEIDLGVPLVDEPPGKVFPASGAAKDVVSALLRAVREAGAALEGGARLVALRRVAEPEAQGAPWRLEIAGRGTLRAVRVILATGGRSLPKTGSDGAGLALAAALGHAIVPPRPALVPLLGAAGRWADLAGVALPAELTLARGDRVLERFTGDFLFTHRGFSGPVVLDASDRLTGAAPPDGWPELRARWGGAERPDAEAALRSGGARTVASVLRDGLPRRLADRLAAEAGVDPAQRCAELSREARRALVRLLDACPLPVAGDEGWGKAEVTAGGVALADVRPADLASRRAEGLYLAGEMLDVVGRLGGFNFLWAWVTGRLAGEAAGRAAVREAAAGAPSAAVRPPPR